MSQQPNEFRDFGILPQGVQPPPQVVRCFLSRGNIIGQYIGSGVVSAIGLGLAALLGFGLPLPLNLLGCAAAIAGFGTFVFLATHNDYRWIELDGNTLRAQHLYTGRVIERPIEEIECLATMTYQIRQLQTVVIEAMLGRIKGVEIRFRDGRTPLRVMRADPAMVNAKEMIEAVVYRMAQLQEVDAEIVTHAGQPLVRYIYWKGETPVPGPGKATKLVLCVGVLLALMFGSILGLIGKLDQRRYLLGSVPPQEISLRKLIENAPLTNPHVVLTDFQFGDSVVEKKSGSWTEVWIALFPPGQRNEIKAVLRSSTIHNEADLMQFVRQGRVKGLCADSPSLTYGTLRTKLVEANPGSQLSSAWVIDEMSEPPSAGKVRALLLSSVAGFVLVLLFVLVIVTRRS